MLVRRDSRTGANDLHTVYRPCKIDEMVGNKTNVNLLQNQLIERNLAHTMLFTGDPGCGKTTAARIIALGLNCESTETMTTDPCLKCASCQSIINHNSMDVMEINAGQSGGKDAVDKVINDLSMAPFYSRYKIIIFDEAHKLTQPAQDLLLKVIEDGFAHVYFIFATNKPEKLKMQEDTAFLTRCNVFHFAPISQDLMIDMLKNVAEFEAMRFNVEILKLIAEESRGIPRRALVWLKQINDENSWTKDAAKNIISTITAEDDPQIIAISKALAINKSFSEASKIYTKIKTKKQAESVRIGIASYITGCLKKAKSYSEGDKFSAALDIINIPIYEQGKVGDYKLYNLLYKVTRILMRD